MAIHKQHAFDRLDYVKKLRATQLTQAQAEAIADSTELLSHATTTEVMRAIDQREFATKSDLALLRSELKGDTALIHREFVLVRSEANATKEFLTARIDNVSEMLTAKIDSTNETLTAKINGVDIKVDSLNKTLTAKIDSVNETLTAKIDSTNARIDSLSETLTIKIDSTNARVDSLSETLTIKIDSANARVDSLSETLTAKIGESEHRLSTSIANLKHDSLKWFIGTGLSIAIALGGFMVFLFKTMH